METCNTFQRIWLLVILAVVSLPPAFADSPQRDGCAARGAPAVSIPFELVGDHIYTKATVNGTGPYRFIVDTGGVNLIDATLANKLSLKITGEETGHGVGAATVESGKTLVDRLGIGDGTFRDQRSYTFDMKQLYPGGGVEMQGMVGASLFQRYATCIDFSHHLIELIDPASFDPGRAGTALSMAVNKSVITVHGSFDGFPGVFQIDTGSPTALVLDSPFVTRHDLLARFPQHVETLSGGVGGASGAYMVRGRQLKLGAQEILRPITELSSGSKGNFARADLSGNIGIGALKRYIVTFDFPGHRLFLAPYRPSPPDLDTYDRSGLRIEIEPRGFKVVSVARDTPASEAGLRTGDLIVAIDGRPAGAISLPELRDELRKRPVGSTVSLDVQTDDNARRVTLTLRDLL